MNALVHSAYESVRGSLRNKRHRLKMNSSIGGERSGSSSSGGSGKNHAAGGGDDNNDGDGDGDGSSSAKRRARRTQTGITDATLLMLDLAQEDQHQHRHEHRRREHHRSDASSLGAGGSGSGRDRDSASSIGGNEAGIRWFSRSLRARSFRSRSAPGGSVGVCGGDGDDDDDDDEDGGGNGRARERFGENEALAGPYTLPISQLPPPPPPLTYTPTVMGRVIHDDNDNDNDNNNIINDQGNDKFGYADEVAGTDNCRISRRRHGRSPDALDPDEVAELKALLPTIRRFRTDFGGKEWEGKAVNADRGGGRGMSSRTLPWLANGYYFDGGGSSGGLDGGGNGDGVAGGNGNDNGSDDDDSSGGGGGGDNDGDDKDRVTYVHLSRDTYSLLYSSGPRTFPFFFSLLVWAFQILILMLVLVDSIDQGDSANNPLHIPAGVSPAVRTAQFLAVLVAVCTQDDLITSLNAIHDGYPGIGWVANERGGTMWQWAIAATCRFVEGGFCLVATWVLIVQSSAVVDLFLDFLAMIFVSDMDNIAFGLAREGYFSKDLKKETKLVATARIPKQSTRKDDRFRQSLFLIVFLGMVAGWTIIVRKQNAGDFQSCNTIAVQFGDSFAPQLAFFSGLYELHAKLKVGGRVTYIESGNGRYDGRAMIAYCEEEASWTFSYGRRSLLTDFDPDPCNWHAKVESEEYDVMKISPSGWYVLGLESSDDVPFLDFSYECVDCRASSSSTSHRGFCSESGRCVNNRCVCDVGRYGDRCEFDEPCPTVEIDTSVEGFPDWPQRYEILHHADGTKAFAYGRPVFVANSTTGTIAGVSSSSSSSDGAVGFEASFGGGGGGGGRDAGDASNGGNESYEFIIFTGRRWMLTSTNTFSNETRRNTRSPSDLARFLSTDFHTYWSQFVAAYSSGPMDMNTPQDSLTPAGLQWYRTKSGNSADANRPLPTLLLCSKCDDEINPCSNDGRCIEGTCRCSYGSFGALCQVSDFTLCRSVAVQYSDGVRASLGTFSGVYDLGGRRIDGRSAYYDRRIGRMLLAYCAEEQAWTLSEARHPFPWTIGRDGGGDDDDDDDDFDDDEDFSTDYGANDDDDGGDNSDSHCEGWIAMSPVTESYDITTVMNGWIVRRTDDADEGVPLDYMSLRCNDCNPDERRSCGIRGTCVNNRCQCDPGRFGPNCELNDPCSSIELDPSRQGFPGMNSSRYDLLTYNNGTDVIAYNRPVYVSAAQNGTFDMIVFIGRRWIVTNSESHELLREATTRDKYAYYFSASFHGYFSNYTINYISEPADVSTLVDTASPTDLAWFEPKSFDNKQVDTSRPIDASLLCSYCNDVDYVCFNGGDCAKEGNETKKGTCSCPFGTYGTLCQIVPTCTRILAQFGPELGEPLASAVGTYVIDSGVYGGRPTFTLGSNNSDGGGGGGGGGGGVFGYCTQDKSWTFTPEPYPDGSDSEAPCRRWVAKSSPTVDFDYVSITSWVTYSNGTSGDLVPLSFFSFSCAQDELIVT